MAQNDPQKSASWPGVDRRQSTVDETAPASAGSHIADNRGMVTERQQRFAAVLIGESGLLREGLKHILDKTDFDVVAAGSTVDALALSPLPDQQALLLILDAGSDPLAAIRQVQLFKEQHPASRVAVLTQADRMTDMTALFQVGANACFPGGVTPLIFLKSLELVMLGETLLPLATLSSIRDRDEAPEPASGNRAARLTTQERCILRSLMEGHPNKAIGNKLGIAEATVKAHVKAIIRKIGVQNRTQAVVWALNNPVLDRSAKDYLPAPAVAAAPAGSTVVTSSIQDETPMELSVADGGSLGDKIEGASIASSKLDEPKTAPRKAFVQQRHALLLERRIAEERERRDAAIANAARLRELRESRDATTRTVSNAMLHCSPHPGDDHPSGPEAHTPNSPLRREYPPA